MYAPCKNCQDRHESCHSECEKYLAFKEHCEQIRKERRKDANVRDYFGERKIKVARIFKHRITGAHKND